MRRLVILVATAVAASLLGIQPAAAADPELRGPTVTQQTLALPSCPPPQEVCSVKATVTTSEVTVASYGKYEKKNPAVWTGSYWRVPYGTTLMRIYTYNYKACLSDPYPLAQIWQECMTGRIYYAYSVVDGVGGLVWGVNYAVRATDGTYYRGSHYCHTSGSYTFLSSHTAMACGEHRFSNLTSMTQWDTFDIDQSGPLGSDTYGFHINAYASGYLSPVYLSDLP